VKTVDLANWTPRPLPSEGPLVGSRVLVSATEVDRDANGLYEATREGDPALWNYLSYGPFEDAAAFRAYLERHVADPEVKPMTVIDRASGAPLGSASYLRIVPQDGVIEIGHIFFGAALQRTAAATEAIYLMIRHAFDDLGYRRVEWKCDAANARSVRAATRFGFTPEGVFRQHRIVRGRNRDTAWFSIIDREWPPLRAAFEDWLAEDNFDAEGRQIRRLEECRAARGAGSEVRPAAS